MRCCLPGCNGFYNYEPGLVVFVTGAFAVSFVVSCFLFGFVNVPEIRITRTYIPTNCTFHEKTVDLAWETSTQCSYCDDAPWGVKTCYELNKYIVALKPEPCLNGTGECPPSDTTCNGGEDCCHEHCDKCTDANGKPYDCRCVCDDGTDREKCTLVPYNTHTSQFTGLINENGQDVVIVIRIAYGTDLPGAVAMVESVPLGKPVDCYYDPLDGTKATLTLEQTPWKWGVTSTFLFLMLIFGTILGVICIERIPMRFLWVGFMWMVFVPLVFVAPATTARLLGPAGRNAILIIVVCFLSIFLLVVVAIVCGPAILKSFRQFNTYMGSLRVPHNPLLSSSSSQPPPPYCGVDGSALEQPPPEYSPTDAMK